MAPAGDAEGLDVRHYLGVFRRRWWIIALSGAIAAASALALSLLQTPVYEAGSTLLIQQQTSDTLFNPNTGQANDPEREVATEIQVIESLPIRSAVEKKLGNDAPTASASAVEGTNVIEVNVRSTNKARAAAAANEYAKAYISFKHKKAVDDVLSAATQVKQKITQLEQQVAALPADSAQRPGVEEQISLFQQQLDQLQVGASLKTGGAQLVALAQIPQIAVSPTPLRTSLLAFVLGLLVGIGIAFLVDHFDDRIRSKEDLEAGAPGLSVLGLVPPVPGWNQAAEEHLATLEMSASPVAEAYRSVRTAIQFLAIEAPVKVLQITSAVPGEGKTTTAANLAVVFAHTGTRTVLIDCDLRRPRLHRFFKLTNRSGLTDVLAGRARVEDVIQQVPDNPGLWLISSGAGISNPSEMLATSAFARLIESAELSADFVIIDSPPVVPVTDGLVVANRVDATILIATAGQTTRRNIRRSLELCRQVGAPVVGAILNKVSEQDQYTYGRYGPYASERVSSARRSGLRS